MKPLILLLTLFLSCTSRHRKLLQKQHEFSLKQQQAGKMYDKTKDTCYLNEFWRYDDSIQHYFKLMIKEK